MSDSYVNLKDEAKIGRKIGQPFIVYEIDYTATDQTPEERVRDKYYVAKTSARYAFTDNSDVELFRVTGNRVGVEIGDLFVCNDSTYNSTPPVTALDHGPNHTFTAFKTDRVGDIMNGDDVVFENIRFSFVPNSEYVGQPLNRAVKGSIGVPSIIAVTFKKALDTTYMSAGGLHLHVTDQAVNQVYIIAEATDFGNLQMLTLVREG